MPAENRYSYKVQNLLTSGCSAAKIKHFHELQTVKYSSNDCKIVIVEEITDYFMKKLSKIQGQNHSSKAALKY